MSRVVVKLGGAVAAREVLALAGVSDVCVVHGAGPQITEAMRARGLTVEFRGGRRVTTAEGLAVVREVLRSVNRKLCEALGERAVGVMGDEVGLEAVAVPELGLVGEPLPLAPRAVEATLAEGLVPVVAPLARGPLNVNADDAAAALAVGLGAERIVFVSDVPGVLLGGAVADALEADRADELLAAGALAGGIVPKLAAAVRAARGGVRAEIGRTEVLV